MHVCKFTWHLEFVTTTQKLQFLVNLWFYKFFFTLVNIIRGIKSCKTECFGLGGIFWVFYLYSKKFAILKIICTFLLFSEFLFLCQIWYLLNSSFEFNFQQKLAIYHFQKKSVTVSRL